MSYYVTLIVSFSICACSSRIDCMVVLLACCVGMVGCLVTDVLLVSSLRELHDGPILLVVVYQLCMHVYIVVGSYV